MPERWFSDTDFLFSSSLLSRRVIDAAQAFEFVDMVAKKTLVLLLGMHRSGTSLAAQYFAETGLPMGNRLLCDPAYDNPEGYWEDADILAVHEGLLRARYGKSVNLWSKRGVEDLTPALCSEEAWVAAVDRLSQLVGERLEGFNAFGFKDPRTARLLPLWKAVSDRLNLKLIAVLLVRHPAEVAGSLERRNGVSPALGELMWLRTIADILREMDDDLKAVINYENWFSQDNLNRRALRRVMRAAGISNMRNPGAIVKNIHRHEMSTTVYLPLVEKVFDGLVANRGNVPSKRARADILHRIDALTDAFGGWGALANVLTMTQAFPSSPVFALALPGEDCKEDAAASTWRVFANPPELINGNPWCLVALEGGYRLHANPPGNPAVSLVWYGVRCSKPARFSAELISTSDVSPKLCIEITVMNGAGDTLTEQRYSLAPGEKISASVSLYVEKVIGIRITVAVDSPELNAYHAALVIYNPRVAVDFSRSEL